MILKTRSGVDAEVRSGFGASMGGVQMPWSTGVASSGIPVTTSNASGLPAVGRAIRLVGGLIGTAMLSVFDGRKGDKHELPSSSQALLLQEPYPGMSDYDWRYDIAVSLEVCENAFLRKIRTGRGKLVALQPVPPKWVNATVDRNGEKQYEISTADGWRRAAAGEILHIRGQTVDGGPFGVSRITQHCDPLGAQLAAQRFEGAYFRNSARPDVALMFPQGVSQEQGREWTEAWNSKYGGVDNAGKAIPLGGGAEIKTIPINMRDAQFIEARQLGVSDVARIMDVEELLLGGGQAEQQDVQAMDRFLAFQMPPRLARIARGLRADPDLFPSGNSSYPEFSADPIMFASPSTVAEVQHKQIQAGTLLPDEARADNGRPPLPDGLGQIPQVTPVGGAPNPAPGGAAMPAEAMPADKPARDLVIVNMPADDQGAVQLRDGLRDLANGMRDQKPPIVRVEATRVNVDAPITVNVPEQPAQAVTVNVPEQPAPVIDVHVPEQPSPVVNVRAEAPIVDVHVPEQQPPVVNVAVDTAPVTVENHVSVPEQPINIDVHVPDNPAPVVNIEPPVKRKLKVNRDESGNAVSYEEE